MPLDGFSFKLEGLENVERILNGLSSDMRRRTVRQGLLASGRVFSRIAKALTKPHDFGSKTRVAGTMRRAITVISSKKYTGANGILGVFLSVRASRTQKRQRPISGDPFYWRWVIGGHKIVPRTARGRSHAQLRAAGLSITQRRRAATARIAGDPIFDKAFRQGAAEAARAFSPAIEARVAKAQQGQ